MTWTKYLSKPSRCRRLTDVCWRGFGLLLHRLRDHGNTIVVIEHDMEFLFGLADDISVMETLESLPSIIASTRNMIGKDTPYLLGPSSIPCRDNPYGAVVSPNPNNSRVCLADMDPRQRGLFAKGLRKRNLFVAVGIGFAAN